MPGSSPRPERAEFPRLSEMKGAPRGMLLYYILNSISIKPKHGYEILQDIDSKTEGAWRPGVGSVYPILRKLLDRGYIKSDGSGSADTRKVYSVTPRGVEMIKDHGAMFERSSQRWMAMRRLFFDMLDPSGMRAMFVEGSRKQFEMTKELLESRREQLTRDDMEAMLREYSLNLEVQLDWTQMQLKGLGSKQSPPRLRRE